MTNLYVNPAVHRPSEKRVWDAAEQLGLDLCPETLSQYRHCIHDILESYERVYRMVETKPPVKYPRTPGYRPPPEENRDNAWYMKTDIHGAPGGKLANHKVAIKDNVCVSGVPMMNGSKLVEGLVPDIDATVVTRILDAGGVIAGKAACCSVCWSGVSFMNDMAPVLHPLDPKRTTGGSSSGCAALIARGEVDMAIGSDQGGSVRVPAAFCGIVGLKPTYGLVPYTGGLSKDPSLDHLGPMAKTAKDCALLMEVIAGADGFDGRQPTHYNPPEYTKLLKTDVSGLRVAVLSEGFDGCQPAVVKAVEHALSLLAKAGAQVDTVSVPMHKLGLDVWKIIDTEGSFENVFNRGGGGPLRRGFRSTSVMHHVHRACVSDPNSLSPPLKVAFLHARIMKDDTNFMFYARASNLRMTLTAAYDEIFKDYDVIAMPTTRNTATLLPTSEMGKPEKTRDLLKAALTNLENTCQFDVTGHPAISVKAGSDEDGFPVGLMFVGAMFQDANVLSAAHAYETLRNKMAE